MSEKGAINAGLAIFTFIIIIGGLVIFELTTLANRTDELAQVTAQTAVTEFVNEVETTGKITPAAYNKLQQTLTSTGYLYDEELVAQIIDENQGKKTTQVSKDKIGENLYYSVNAPQIKEKIDNGEAYILTEGSRFYAKYMSISSGISQDLSNLVFKITGKNTAVVVASDGGVVTATGKN